MSSLVYNEHVVKKLLDESDPDVAFLARTKMMRAHLHEAVAAASRGEMGEAREHITHPASEILPEMLEVLKSRNLIDPTPVLATAAAALQDDDHHDLEKAMQTAIDAIVLIEESIHPDKMVIDGILADAAVLLLRTAVSEYAVAFKYGKIVNIVEYHDGSAFVDEASRLIRSTQAQWLARDSKAYYKLDRALDELQKAWPGNLPPEKLVVPLTKMLALVAIIELQINQIRAGS